MAARSRPLRSPCDGSARQGLLHIHPSRPAPRGAPRSTLRLGRESPCAPSGPFQPVKSVSDGGEDAKRCLRQSLSIAEAMHRASIAQTAGRLPFIRAFAIFAPNRRTQRPVKQRRRPGACGRRRSATLHRAAALLSGAAPSPPPDTAPSNGTPPRRQSFVRRCRPSVTPPWPPVGRRRLPGASSMTPSLDACGETRYSSSRTPISVSMLE